MSDVEILVAEDNPADARLTLEAFKEWKISNRIHLVSDGEEALQYLLRQGKYQDSKTPDLIFLDLNMPKMNGSEVLEQIKLHSDLKHIPVIMLSTSRSELDVYKSYSLHANSYIVKPIDFEQFTTAIKGLESYWLNIVKLPKVS